MNIVKNETRVLTLVESRENFESFFIIIIITP